MNILVTLDANYIRPLKVALASLFLNNPSETFTVYLMHSTLKESELDDLQIYIAEYGNELEPVFVADDYFTSAPAQSYYTKEMYYRLLAFKFLPSSLERVLYLDPDILVINPVRNLYETDLTGYLYGAAYHDKLSINEVNKLRLTPYDIKAYYNSGVLLMNLEEQRQSIDERDIFTFVKKNHARLVMPDQDVLNALYSRDTRTLNEILYNYDTRFYSHYLNKTNGFCDMDYIMRETVILHFCGKKKPWHQRYSGRFHALYKHYEKLALG